MQLAIPLTSAILSSQPCSLPLIASCPASSVPAAAKDANWRNSPVLVSTLKMVGSCRGADDEQRLQQLQQYADELGIGDAVEWHVNVPYSELKQLLGGAVGGLHTMLDEHFGISVVEYMAAGGLQKQTGHAERVSRVRLFPCGVIVR